MNKYDLIANPPKFGVTSLLIEQLLRSNSLPAKVNAPQSRDDPFLVRS